MHPRSYYIINGITVYRLVAALFLLALLLVGELEIFKWMLALSFFTDAIDGFLARKFRVTSAFGARLDSIADDLTVGVAMVGVIIVDPVFIRQHATILLILFGLFILENLLAILRFRRFTSFHTYLAKTAAVFQGVFLITFFFIGPVETLFYLAAAFTLADLLEEIVLVFVLPRSRSNVHGLPWVMKKKNQEPRTKIPARTYQQQS